MAAAVTEYVHNLAKVLTNRAGHFMGFKSSHEIPGELNGDVAAAAAAVPDVVEQSVIAAVRATSGLVTGRIKLNAWATNQKERLDTMAGISILKNCVLCLLNGALGQRGLLMQRIQIYNIAVRCTGMTVDFSVWLPSVKSHSDEPDRMYALCIKDALSRLSTEEVRQYFPLFIFQSTDDTPEGDSMVSMPMSAPAPVPHEEGEGEVVAPKDSCEMMLCTTKQKKRKGVPYCGTCRKFMEETVKWYCDVYGRHPAKEKDLFVPAVRNDRYQCKHPNTTGCDCKACHSLRRFEEMYPKCEAKLDEFKRRTFMFESKGAEKPNRGSGTSAVDAADGGGPRSAAKSRGSRASGRGEPKAHGSGGRGKVRDSFEAGAAQVAVSARSQQAEIAKLDYGTAAAAAAAAAGALPKTPVPAFAARAPGQQHDDGYGVPAMGYGAPAAVGGGPRARKRKNSLNLLPMPVSTKARVNGPQGYDEVMSSLLPNYIFQIPPTSPIKDLGKMPAISPSALNAGALDLETDSLYKELCLEDPLTFSALENMASTAPLNTWLCAVCASWNHPSRGDCSRCASKRV
mmetsp:Transcript_34796/g.104864  ORF Transcript_34796/g.104864 Transcript_34796/m.104864 type:complete len:569 (-) Transcript_34796:72-1778(-)